MDAVDGQPLNQTDDDYKSMNIETFKDKDEAELKKCLMPRYSYEVGRNVHQYLLSYCSWVISIHGALEDLSCCFQGTEQNVTTG